MKKQILLFSLIFFTINIFGISIHDIQYTNTAGDGTYPSDYNGSTVTTGGIVTGVKSNKTFFIESSSGGAWSGIYVYDKNNSVSLGDSLIITGEVYEYYELTEINDISAFQKVSSGNPLPIPVQISTNDVNSDEAYESVLITIHDLLVIQKPTGKNWKVDDGSGECTISDGFYNIISNGYTTPKNDSLKSISGIINYSYGNYLLNPRNINDYDTLIKDTLEISNLPIGDTLTIIQKPLLNIPFIGTVGDTIKILCKKNEQVNNWSATIQFKNFNYPLPIFDIAQDGNFYNLSAIIPKTEFYELFDLIVSTGTETDTTENAVKIISDWKQDYYFIHITDSHLPTHLFSTNNDGYKTDTSEMVDLREVMKDINLLNPEFVLFTGDIINEGELEDYQNGRYYTKSQKLISEFEVPVYVTSGNHDLGGWIQTPPVQGTARRDWWRFYGWKWLENTTNFYPYHTQNYHFKYGSQNFIGLEAYDNYDSCMYDIYGSKSFTTDQLKYLKTTLSNIPTNEQKILFYHYDFSNQIDLSELGVDMALWGHIHKNQGNIDTYPYNLATAAVCDERRAYRIIKVVSNELHPQNTIYAGNDGETLKITYSPANDGVADYVTATIVNQNTISFENCLVKFKMPKTSNYQITNGNLTQIVEYDDYNICYVKINLSASKTTSVSIKSSDTSVKNDNRGNNYYLNVNYPNPFNSYTTIEYHIPKEEFVTIKVYKISGELVKTLVNTIQTAGSYSIQFNANDLSSGIYFYRMTAGDFSATKKYVLVK